MSKETAVGKDYVIAELRNRDQWSLRERHMDEWCTWSSEAKDGNTLMGFRDWLITRLDEGDIDIQPEIGSRRTITVTVDLERAEDDAVESTLMEMQERFHAVLAEEYMPNGRELSGYTGPLVTRIKSTIEEKS